MMLPPEEIFFRAFRTLDFDICELSMSSFTVKTAQGNCPYVGVPAFVSRMFRHNCIYVRTDRIKKPEDLKGKRVGLPEYQLTACVWARAILEDDYGVKPSDITWVRGGIDDPTRPEKITIKLPPDVTLTDAPEGKTISQLLESRRHRRLHRAAGAAARGEEESEYRLAVSRSDRGRQGLLQAHRHFSDHARHRRAPHAGRAASLAAGGGAQGVRAGESQVHGGDGGHRHQQMHAAVPGRAAQSRTRTDGARFLELWPGAEPQGAGDVLASPPFGRTCRNGS